MSQNKGGVQTLSPDEITYNGCTIVPITAKLCIFKLRHAVLGHLAKNLGCTQYAKTSTPTHLIVLILHTLITNMGTTQKQNYLIYSFLTLLAEEPSMPSSISSLSSFLILRPPCSQASGVYQVLSWTVFCVTLVLLSFSSFISSSVMVWALNVSRTSLGPLGLLPFLLFKPPMDLFQSMNCSLLCIYWTDLQSYWICPLDLPRISFN